MRKTDSARLSELVNSLNSRLVIRVTLPNHVLPGFETQNAMVLNRNDKQTAEVYY